MKNATEIPVILRNGFWRNGGCQREVRVRAIAENEDGFVESLSASKLPLERNTRLLEYCVLGLGREQDVGQLSLGDRDVLLLHARQLTFGGRIDCELPCPGCGERMDFQLQVDGLLLDRDSQDRTHYFEETMNTGTERVRVRFRLPCGADLEQAFRSGQTDAAMAEIVLKLAVESLGWEGMPEDARSTSAIAVREWPAGLAARISERMAELDPQAEMALQLTCPACGHIFTTSFDIGDYFFHELIAREHGRYRDVHELALAYHWSEAEILNMSSQKRRMYLDLLTESYGD
jgi:hypothetical protein